MRKLKTPNYAARLRVVAKIEILMEERTVIDPKAKLVADRYDPESLGLEVSSMQESPRHQIASYLNSWERGKHEEKLQRYLSILEKFLASSSNKAPNNFPLRLSYNAVKYLFGSDHKIHDPCLVRFEFVVDSVFHDEDYDPDDNFRAMGFNSFGDYMDWEIDRLLAKPD